MMPLRPDESVVVGAWTMREGRVVADENCERIDWLVSQVLVRLAATDWNVLYRDPADGRMWEFTYPQSHMQGGGPPALKLVSIEDAAARFEIPRRSA